MISWISFALRSHQSQQLKFPLLQQILTCTGKIEPRHNCGRQSTSGLNVESPDIQGPNKQRSKVEHSAVAACMREAKANTRALQHATDQVHSLHALVQPARKRCRGLDVREAKVAGGQPTSWSQNVAVAYQRIREDILGSHFGRGCPLLIRRVLAHTQQRENESVTPTQTLQSHSRAQSYIHVYAEPHF